MLCCVLRIHSVVEVRDDSDQGSLVYVNGGVVNCETPESVGTEAELSGRGTGRCERDHSVKASRNAKVCVLGNKVDRACLYDRTKYTDAIV